MASEEKNAVRKKTAKKIALWTLGITAVGAIGFVAKKKYDEHKANTVKVDANIGDTKPVVAETKADNYQQRQQYRNFNQQYKSQNSGQYSKKYNN